MKVMMGVGLAGCVATLNGKPMGGGSSSGGPPGEQTTSGDAAGGGGGAAKQAVAPKSNAKCPNGKRFGFAPADTLDGHRAWSVGVADVNGDGKADIVVGSEEKPGPPFSSSLGVALNQGDGTFAEVQLSGFGKDPNWAEAIRLAVGDINGDGKADAVGVSNSAGLPAFALSNGDGTFAAGVAFTRGTTAEGGGVPLIVDIDGDSRNDIVVPPRSWHNAGKGKLISENLYDKNYRRDGVAVADFDGDGSVDLATSGNGDGILLWKSNGNGTFATEPVKFADPQIAGHIVAGDFNGDGKPDIAAPGESISILTNQGDGNFSGPSYLQLNGIGGADRVNELVAADLNGDKLVDLAAITWASYGKGENVVVFMNNGKGKFAAPLLVPSGRPTQLAAGVIGPEGVMSLVAVEPVMQGNDSKSTIYIMRATCR